jgi:hypothetical protein
MFRRASPPPRLHQGAGLVAQDLIQRHVFEREAVGQLAQLDHAGRIRERESDVEVPLAESGPEIAGDDAGRVVEALAGDGGQ